MVETPLLRPFQRKGKNFLVARKTALLGDEMGLGKTPQALVAAAEIKASSIQVVCPASARENWRREARIWAPGIPFFVHSYNEVSRRQPKGPWGVLILDESHYLKSPDAIRTKAVYGKKGMVHRAGRIWALSGTPIMSHPAELWTTLYTLGGLKMTYDAFVARHCLTMPDPHKPSGFKVIGGQNLAELKSSLDGFMLRRLKSEVMPELPEIQYEQVFLDNHDFVGPRGAPPTEETWGDECFASLRLELGRAKLAPTLALLKENLDSGMHKVVVFAHHTSVIHGLVEGLKGYGVVSIWGGTPVKKRMAKVDEFQRKGYCRVFVAQMDAASESITLTASSNVVIVERGLTPAKNAQAIARCHRIGQTRGVLARFISLAGTLDEPIMGLLRRKTEIIAELFD